MTNPALAPHLCKKCNLDKPTCEFEARADGKPYNTCADCRRKDQAKRRRERNGLPVGKWIMK